MPVRHPDAPRVAGRRLDAGGTREEGDYERGVEERERKLTIGADVALPDPASLFAELGSWTDETVEQVATYFDTADLRLTRAGASLRFRSDDGWTVKTPIHAGTAELRRREHAFAGSIDARPAAAEELVLGWSRTAEPGAGRPDHDPAPATPPHRRRHRAGRGGRRPGRGPARRLRRRAPSARSRSSSCRGGRSPDPARARNSACATPVPAPSPTVPDRRSRGRWGHAPARPRTSPTRARPARDATLGTLDARTRSVVPSPVSSHHDHVVRVGDDPEGVHQARVATRRLRSDLHTFAPLLDPVWADGLRAELQWLGRLLGRVRDADVLLERLELQGTRLPRPDRAGVGRLTAQLQASRAHDRTELLDAMVSPRYLALLDRLVDAAAAPHLVDTRPAPRAAPGPRPRPAAVEAPPPDRPCVARRPDRRRAAPGPQAGQAGARTPSRPSPR